jgi:hypothetical protein
VSRIDDFEIRLGLRAQQLTSHVPTEAATRAEAVTLTRREQRSRLPASIKPEEAYENIVVEKQQLGRLENDN